MKKRRQPKHDTRLIVATSETDADLLYASRFWAPDPFIFLQQNGKRTLVLSDLEIDRGGGQPFLHEAHAVDRVGHRRVPADHHRPRHRGRGPGQLPGRVPG